MILLAALLIETVSFMQYRYMHGLLQDELDYRAEGELTMKSMRVRGILRSHERLMNSMAWPIGENLATPDSLYDVLRHFVAGNSDLMSAFVAYVPGSYGKDELLEPVVYRHGDSLVVRQIASANHDYTQRDFYRNAMTQDVPTWSDPYLDSDASGQQITTYAIPLRDASGKTVAVFGIDMSTRGIIDTLNTHNTHHNYPSSFYLLLTEDGRLISQPDSSHSKLCDVDDVVRMINDTTIERKFSSTGHSRVIKFNDDQHSTGYAYYAFMKGLPHWKVVMVCYDDEVYGKLNRMRRYMLLLMLAGLALLGFILYRYNTNVQRLHQSILNKERTDSELRIAQGIQSEMLPSHGITRPDVSVEGYQVTALEVGGDLYDFLVRDEKLYFCIGDVSGKGVPSSLVMAVVHSHFRNLSQHESNPAHIMQAINEASAEGNTTNMFVTMFIGVLDLPTGRLRYCNAGHDAPLLIGSEVRQLNVMPNLPLGLFADFKYQQQQEQLPSDTTLFLYTDGLTEASNREHELYGLQRVIDSARQCLLSGSTAPAQLMTAMHDDVLRFAGGAQQSDDLTMLALHYMQTHETQVLNDTITLLNDVHQVPELNQFVQSVCNRLNLDPSVASQMMLAVEEAVVNVMNYAYPIGSQGSIIVDASATRQSLKFIITDEGKAFDPTQRAVADTSLTAEERPIGGLGILLVQQLMDSINYERVNGKNVLTLKKML